MFVFSYHVIKLKQQLCAAVVVGSALSTAHTWNHTFYPDSQEYAQNGRKYKINNGMTFFLEFQPFDIVLIDIVVMI